jgi:hypothetical protein
MSIIIPSGVINSFVRKYRLRTKLSNFDLKDVYLSTKAGPHGPATLSALDNLLLFNYIDMQRISNITDEYGFDYFCKEYKFAFENDIRPSKHMFRGKISFIKDPEAKLRIVAISDYFTQLFLKKIHDKLFKLVTNLKQDRSFSQDPLNKWDYNNSERF